MRRDDGAAVYVWAGLTPDDVPDRVPMLACPKCAAVIESERLGEHREWHRTQDGAR